MLKDSLLRLNVNTVLFPKSMLQSKSDFVGKNQVSKSVRNQEKVLQSWFPK